MFIVYFYENKDLLLIQLRKTIPTIGETIRIKGRNGTISTISQNDSKHVHVYVTLEKVNKNKIALETSKKKKR